MSMYDELGEMMGELEADADILEMVILNGKNEKANIYLRDAITLIKRAVSDMSDAVFEVSTSQFEEDDL